MLGDTSAGFAVVAVCFAVIMVALWRAGNYTDGRLNCTRCGERVRESHLRDDGSWACRRPALRRRS